MVMVMVAVLMMVVVVGTAADYLVDRKRERETTECRRNRGRKKRGGMREREWRRVSMWSVWSHVLITGVSLDTN